MLGKFGLNIQLSLAARFIALKNVGNDLQTMRELGDWRKRDVNTIKIRELV
jgi:hypothetical protein